MNKAATTTYKRVKRIIAGSFDKTKLPSYSLCAQIGVRDFQFSVINNQTNSCIFLEDYRLEKIKTINGRLEAISEVIEKHPVLSSTLWENIKLSFKTHKFSLVPHAFFLPGAAGDYLTLNSEIKPSIEEVYYYKHITFSAVNVFTCDKKTLSWFKRRYPQKRIQVLHQGSALMDGILCYDDHSADRTMFSFFDRGIIHIVVTEDQKILYYNQFATRKAEDYLKYIMLVFKEMKLSPKSDKLIIWGNVANDSPQIELIKKYIRNISFGSKPNFIKLGSEFDSLADHRYFDVFSISLCE